MHDEVTKSIFAHLIPAIGVVKMVVKDLDTSSPVKEKTDRTTTPMMESGGLMRWT